MSSQTERQRAQAQAARPPRHLALALAWGVLVGVIQAVSPLGFWWLPATTVYAFELAIIAAVYVGFGVADGRPKVIAVESVIAAMFAVVAASAVTTSAWVLVAGFISHGAKDLWQHRTQYVANTRWWPPFCVAVDVVVALALAVVLLANAQR
jgi:hypothetical protein